MFAAYGFLTLVDPGGSVAETISVFRGMEEVAFANAFVGGSFDGFVALKSDSFETIQTFIAETARLEAAESIWSILVRAALILMAPHKTFEFVSEMPHHESLTRVRTEPRQATAVLEAIDSLYAGMVNDEFGARAAIVTGDRVDILLELASPSLEPLQTSIVNDLARVEGIVASDTSFAFVEGSAA